MNGDHWIAVRAAIVRDLLVDVDGTIRKLDQLVADHDVRTGNHSRLKARMFAVDARDRLRLLLNPPHPVQAQTEGQGARDIDPRELATILNLRGEIAEWRKATMLENQDTATPDHLRQHLQDIGDEADRMQARLKRIEGVIASAAAGTDFLRDLQLEAAHQVDRWGVEHDAGKRPEDWITLMVYLLGKAARAHFEGNRPKLLHHIVTGAAVLFNWWRRETGAEITMRPGIASPTEVPPCED